MIIRGMLQVGFESLARLGRVGIQHGGQTLPEILALVHPQKTLALQAIMVTKQIAGL